MINNDAVKDYAKAVSGWRVVLFLAFGDLRARYKRSVLGPFWVTLGTAIGSTGLGFLWSELLHIDAVSFVPSLTAGLILWQYISGLISESTGVFVRQAQLIRNLDLPLSIHPFQLLFRHFINLLHNTPVLLAVCICLGVPITKYTFLAIPGVLILSANLLWIALIFGLLGARFRDLEYFVSTVLPLLMFISPVFYRPNYLPFSEWIIWMNPFSHFIEIVRYPLLGTYPPLFVVVTNLTLLLFGWSIATLFFCKKHNRVAFWV